jgi:hypothetical protein
VFANSRFTGSSIATIDRHDGHLVGNSREHAVSLLDALARVVDAGWTSQQKSVRPLTDSITGSQEAVPTSGGRPVDAETRNRHPARNEKELKSSNFVKPSNGLEPLTPSLR